MNSIRFITSVSLLRQDDTGGAGTIPLNSEKELCNYRPVRLLSEIQHRNSQGRQIWIVEMRLYINLKMTA